MTSASADLDRYLALSLVPKAPEFSSSGDVAAPGSQASGCKSRIVGAETQLLVPSSFHHGVLGPHDKCFMEGGSSLLRARIAR